jgi:hypothetical protein
MTEEQVDMRVWWDIRGLYGLFELERASWSGVLM